MHEKLHFATAHRLALSLPATCTAAAPSTCLPAPDRVAEALCDQPVQAGQRRVCKGSVLAEQQDEDGEQQAA